MNPISVGFLDLNPEGQFHLERMRLRDDFRCLAGWGNGHDLKNAHGILEHVAQSPQELIDDPRIDLLWVGPAVDPSLLEAALNAGKHVLIGLPLDCSSTGGLTWKSAEAAGITSKLFVSALHRWDGQFQTVLQQVRQGNLGQITDVRRISRQYVPVELGSQARAGHAGSDPLFATRQELRVRQTKWFEMLDELLLLVPEPVISVMAHNTGGSGADGQRSGQCACLEFANGCRAWLELNRLSLAPLETGWVLDGSIAGFVDGKRFHASSEYELIDVPVEERPTDQAAFYDSVVATIRNGNDFTVTSDSIQRVLQLNDSIKRSIQSGQAVSVNSCSGIS